MAVVSPSSLIKTRCDPSKFTRQDFQDFAIIDCYLNELGHMLKTSAERFSTSSAAYRSAIVAVKLKIKEKYGNENALDVIGTAITTNLAYTNKFLESMVPFELSSIPISPLQPQLKVKIRYFSKLTELDEIEKTLKHPVTYMEMQENSITKNVYHVYAFKFPDGMHHWVYSTRNHFENDVLHFNSGFCLSIKKTGGSKSFPVSAGTGPIFWSERTEKGPFFWGGHIGGHISGYIALQVNVKALKLFEDMKTLSQHLPVSLPTLPTVLVKVVREYYASEQFVGYDPSRHFEYLFELAQEALGKDLKNPFD